MHPVEIVEGASPVILSAPHAGTHVPPAVFDRLNDRGKALTDTDWRVDTLYDGLLAGATRVGAVFHRYVIDANRDPEGASLYPGQNTTGLVPETDFDGLSIWRDGEAPGAAEIAERRAEFHAPYHAALAEQIARVRDRWGVAVLYDCHSIRSHIPYLFDGRLPDLNIGTNDGVTCAAAVEAAIVGACAAASDYTHVLNGRFKGGWTTRRYGRPADGVHAVQMEISQAAYLASELPPYAYSASKADRLRPVLAGLLSEIEALAANGVLAP